MLVKPHQLFATALQKQCALGAFNTSNLEFSQAIIQAAEKMQSPVIVQTSEGALEYAGIKTLTAIIRTLAEESDVPVVLHLDHGKKIETIKQCIEVGYTSVMIDASKSSFQENIALTQEVVEYAHARGVWVEAELGAILGKEGARDLGGSVTPDDMLTQPKEVVEFIAKTGVDALAVSVGTIHGAFSGQEYIRFELLAEIEKAVPHMPLVLHGASAIAGEHLKRAVKTNVCKINVDTDIRISFERAVKAFCAQEHVDVDPRDMLGAGREAVQQTVEEKIGLFGSSALGKVQ